MSRIELTGQTLVFSGGKFESDVDGEEEEFVFHPRVKKIPVKTAPPKFNGDSTKFIALSEEFMRFAARWGL